MVAFDPNALIQDLLTKKQTLNPLGGRRPSGKSIQNRANLDPIDRAQDRQANLTNKLAIINEYAPDLEPEDKYLNMADELMFRANQIAAKAAETRAFRPVNFRGGPPDPVLQNSPRAAVQQVRSKKQKGAPVAKGDFGAFVQAIAGKESGGSYSARNPHSGAMGKYQIMPSNIEGPGGWDQEILGRNITTQQFMANPGLQDQIALGKLRQYYNKYGVRGAASAWYSGDPNKWRNTSPQGGYPSIAAYVQDIIRRMGMR
jgi:hypothetical protein